MECEWCGAPMIFNAGQERVTGDEWAWWGEWVCSRCAALIGPRWLDELVP